jgi:transglutaminase-like putative cysteine protease
VARASPERVSISCPVRLGHLGYTGGVVHPFRGPERALRAVLGAFSIFLCGGQVRAEPVLHEYVPNVDPREAEAAGVAAGGVTLGAESKPAASIAGGAEPGAGTEGAPPAYDATAGDGSPGEPPGRRSPSFRPDRLTELSSGLDYYEVFAPSIAPFKRVTSLGLIQLDADRKTPVFAARENPRTVVRVEGEHSRPPDARPRDRFTGDVRLDFRQGPLVPLPSVSPESRILTLRATPALPLRVERDADDNFAVRLLVPVPDVPVRVEFLTDAPRSYFGTEIPDARVNVLESEVKKLEPSIESRGLAMAKRMRLSKSSELRTALATLTSYFRAFEESSTPPENTGDLYLDLVRSQKGICRHRAYGFVVTAQALGIPARFVQNEAHSWVEVKLPRVGFMRIDLGGAANGLTAHNASEAPSYVPAQPDTLPQPASYRRSYARAAARARGARPSTDSLTGRWLNPDSVQHNESSGNSGRANGEPGEEAGEGTDSSAAARTTQDGRSEGRRQPKQPLAIQLEERSPAALRGGEVSLSGRVEDAASHGVAGVRVEIWISAQRRDERMLLGVCVTDAAGAFNASLGVPPDLQVGDYRLLVLTPGDSRFAAAIAP